MRPRATRFQVHLACEKLEQRFNNTCCGALNSAIKTFRQKEICREHFADFYVKGAGEFWWSEPEDGDEWRQNTHERIMALLFYLEARDDI